MKTKNVLEWLSEENQPSARYHALKEHLGKVESGSFPFVGFGLISQFPIELVLIADIALALLFVNVRRMYAVRENTERDVRGGGLVNSARHTHEEFGTCLA